MFSKKTLTYLFKLFICANIVNIVFLFLRLYGVVMLRPVVVYEYLLIPILIAFRVPRIITWFYFLIVLLIDVTSHLSFIYLFSIPDFIKSLQFFGLYDFSISHYVLLSFFFFFVLFFFWLLKKLSIPEKEFRPLILIFFLGFSIIVYSIDSLSGRTLLNGRRIISIYDFNLGSALSRDVILLIKDISTTASRPTIENTSLTFRTFANDTTGNQLLIILESWGLPTSEREWSKIKNVVSNASISKNWTASFGSTKFKGGTVHSELRELVSANGDYRYFLDADSAKNFHSIFNIKKNQGYSTMAIHSFSGRMFQRTLWWKNIGIDSGFFMENIVARNKLTPDKLNYTSPFSSLHDEDAFIFVNGQRASGKKFAYFLSVNTHLPYSYKASQEKILISDLDVRLSPEAMNQLQRIVDLLIFFINEGEKGNWSKILIVGDHMPPVSNEFDRNYYSQLEVPFLILSR